MKPLEWYEERIGWLSGFMTPEREETLRSTLGMRTRYMTICTENTFHPQNASALIRNCEAFGLQDIHAIETLCRFRPNVQIVKGTDKWVDLHRHPSTAEAITSLKGQGYRIIATTPHIDGATPCDFDISPGPFVLFFGTEHAGLSQEVLTAADGYIHIPMQGFVESLNVSASAAILLYNLTSAIRSREDIPWRLEERHASWILYRWMRSTVKDSGRILERKFNNDI